MNFGIPACFIVVSVVALYGHVSDDENFLHGGDPAR